ncbi:hypothetical protein [Streptomyces djakartensis]|uniref:hypothetical protein n=1 Tax=Streptomyces djakartensis TaxID=68193 RepID=UPI0034DE6B59
MATIAQETVLSTRLFIRPVFWNERTRWAAIWAAWGAYFAAAEYVAVRSKHPDAPLSSHLRLILGVKKQSRHTRAGQVAAAAGVIWLADHLYRQEK